MNIKPIEGFFLPLFIKPVMNKQIKPIVVIVSCIALSALLLYGVYRTACYLQTRFWSIKKDPLPVPEEPLKNIQEVVQPLKEENKPRDICNLDEVYNEAFQYSLPRPILESYLSGKAFDNSQEYSLEESENLKQDIHDIYQNILSKNLRKEALAVMTCGAPGVGKTTLMRQKLEHKEAKGNIIAYICPDDVCLKEGQKRTYLLDLEKNKQEELSDEEIKTRRQAAYNKWRPGSNAATHLILANLIRDKMAFYFGTTSSGPATCKFLESLKKQGYKIKLLHLTAPDQIRWQSIQERDKTFVQTTEKDVIEKGWLVPQRINDTYLKYADTIQFFYRDGVQQHRFFSMAVLAAKWIRNDLEGENAGTLSIVDRNRYEEIKKIHNATCTIIKREDLFWDLTVEKNAILAN